MTNLTQVRNAYLFVYGPDGSECDPGSDYEETCQDFDEWLDLHTLTQIRRYLVSKAGEISSSILESTVEDE